MVALVNIVWILSGISVYFWAFTTVFSFFSKGFVFVGCANISTRLVFQITTRSCPSLIQRTIDSVLESCKQLGYTNFQICIVTDNPDPPSINGIDTMIVVPANFSCSAKYKARALEYSRLVRINKGYHGWIYFLDEENWLSVQTVKAITSFAQSQSRLIASGPLAFFGHGSKLAWLGDSIRTSICRTCHFGHSLGHWPLHGENMLVHSEIEKKVNWLGSSLTEDFLFSSRAAAVGYKTGWHGGVLNSYSPSSLTDLILQRRRWFRGFIGIVFTVIFRGYIGF